MEYRLLTIIFCTVCVHVFVCACSFTHACVCTRYNNKTYRIDDIDWDHNPSFEFETRQKKVTMMQYYKEVRRLTTVVWMYQP